MKGVPVLVLLMLLASMTATAQEVQLRPAKIAEKEVEAEKLRPLHITDKLLGSPEGQAALHAFQEAKKAGTLPTASKTAYALNDTVTFNVGNNVFTTFEWIEQEFVLKATGGTVNIWVELGEIDNLNVEDDDIARLQAALIDSTPEGSFNPNAGIIANDDAVFGTPPNYDGDGMVDILLYDIIEGGTTCCINGFVSGQDVNPNAPANQGNQADVLYLDTDPTLTDPGRFGFDDTFILVAAAHEYQHLIHFNYDGNEMTLVNEGLSEWAEVMNGYEGRRMTYLSDADGYNVSLLRWDTNTTQDDYQRGGLFTTYFADRTSALAAGSITRETANGAQGYEAALAANNAGFSLRDLMLDFHIANFLNDPSLNPNYGYVEPQRQGLQAVPTFEFDGRTDSETDISSRLEQGGVEYIVWNQVTDMDLTLDVPIFGESLAPTALTFKDGTFQTQTLGPNSSTSFPGTFTRIVLVMAHVVPSGIGVDYSVDATWDAGQAFEEQVIVYDDGSVPFDAASNVIEAFQVGGEARQASRFEIPEGSVLSSVSVAPYYENRFQGSGVPDNAPRDFLLKVWADDGGDVGVPGDELFSLDVTDDRFNQGQGELVFLDIDLNAYSDQLSSLPPVVHIGIMNKGTDANHLVMGVTEFDGSENPSSIYLATLCSGSPCWGNFTNITAGGEPILQDRVLPIRAKLLVPIGPVSTDDEVEMPTQITLHANYPNPFNPTTTIRYSLPQATNVKLVVFDLLGREVATLVDGVIAPGEYQVQVNASDWASGVYFYTLEAAGQRQSQRMVLLK